MLDAIYGTAKQILLSAANVANSSGYCMETWEDDAMNFSILLQDTETRTGMKNDADQRMT